MLLPACWVPLAALPYPGSGYHSQNGFAHPGGCTPAAVTTPAPIARAFLLFSLARLGLEIQVTLLQIGIPGCHVTPVPLFHTAAQVMNESTLRTDLLLKRLKSFEFLRGLDEATLVELAKSAAWKIFAPDAVIFWEGDIETVLFYLQYGWLKVIRTAPDGREQVLRFLGPGEIFNELGVFARRPNPATAIALADHHGRDAVLATLLGYPGQRPAGRSKSDRTIGRSVAVGFFTYEKEGRGSIAP